MLTVCFSFCILIAGLVRASGSVQAKQVVLSYVSRVSAVAFCGPHSTSLDRSIFCTARFARRSVESDASLCIMQDLRSPITC